MASRWMEGKLARMKRPSTRFIITTRGQDLTEPPQPYAENVKEARSCSRRVEPMPENKSSNHDIIAAYLAGGGMVKRIPCRGVMPARSYGKICKGHTRAGLNLNPISERTARERPHDFAPNGLLVWSADKSVRLLRK